MLKFLLNSFSENYTKFVVITRDEVLLLLNVDAYSLQL